MQEEGTCSCANRSRIGDRVLTAHMERALTTGTNMRYPASSGTAEERHKFFASLVKEKRNKFSETDTSSTGTVSAELFIKLVRFHDA